VQLGFISYIEVVPLGFTMVISATVKITYKFKNL